MRGSSGAKILVRDDHAIKIHHNDRLHRQAMWLTAYKSPVLPEVWDIGDGYYTMERLVEPPHWAIDPNAIITRMISDLDQYIWSQEPVTDIDHDRLTLKIIEITHHGAQEFRSPLFDIVKQIDWPSLKRCMTHGDPTYDNVMFRRDTGELVLIDPIPATPAIPNLMSVDFGKMLQSCVGFEHARYDDIMMQFRVSPLHLKMFVPNENEWLATQFWCIVHLLRALPYMPAECYDSVKNLAVGVKDSIS